MAASPERSLPEYTLAEVKQHGSPDDLWMILYNRVYDFTAFSAQHPGGAEVLFDCGGVDATEAFEDVGHSKNACEMLAPFLLGRVPENDEKCHTLAMAGFVAPAADEDGPPKKSRPDRKPSRRAKRDNSIGILAALAFLACVAFLALQRLKWASIVS